MITLFPYQHDAIDRARDALTQGHRSILIVIATGGGKTVVATQMISSAAARGLTIGFFAPRRELIQQCFCKLVEFGIDPLLIGIIMSGVDDTPCPALFDDEPVSRHEIWARYARRNASAPIQVGSIQTAHRRDMPRFGLIFLDEAHAAVTKMYDDLCASQPQAIIIGLTATPERTDGVGLGRRFSHMVIGATSRQLMTWVNAATGKPFLCTPQIWTVPTLPDLSGVRMRGSDYDENESARACDRRELIGDMIYHWHKRANGFRTVAFAVNVRHSKHIAQMFNEAGIPWAHLDGETSEAERDSILRRLHDGDLRGVSNCGVLCEGWDDKKVWCGISARPTTSWQLHTQQIGRIVRPDDDKTAIWLDHSGNAAFHGPPWLDHAFQLGDRKKRTKSVASGKVCGTCFAVVASTEAVCPGCSTVFPIQRRTVRDRMPKVGDGELVLMNQDERRSVWDRIIIEWHKQNDSRKAPLSPSWCSVRFKELFGEYQPRHYPLPELTEKQKAAKAAWNETVGKAKAAGLPMRRAVIEFNQRKEEWDI